MIECIDPKIFFELQRRFFKVPFTQTEAWYNYLSAQGKHIVFFAESFENPSIIVWGVSEKIPFSNKKILKIEGECCHDYTDDRIRTFFGLLKKQNYTGIEVNSNTLYNVDFEVNIRRAGFVRPIGSFSCPLTIELDLQKKIGYNRNWKRNIALSKENALSFQELHDLTEVQIEGIVKLFSQMADLKSLGYRLSAFPVSVLTGSEGIRTFAVSDRDGQTLALRIIHVRENMASDVIAANSDAARLCGATFFLMQCIFETLAANGVELFDFGRIGPSDKASDNVYLFKNATHGRKIQYNGEWVYYRSRFSELIVFVYKWLKIKKQRY